jgi:hypothetical protein
MPGKRFAFVLSVWIEEAGGEAPGSTVWRGSVQSADGQKVMYFSSLERLVEILSAVSGWDEDQPLER